MGKKIKGVERMTEKRFETNNLVKKGSMSFWDNENKLILNASHSLDLLNDLSEKNEQLKEHLSSWRSSCCSYLNAYSILDNEVSILKETKDLDRFFEKFNKYCRMPFDEVEKSFIELQTENEQLKLRIEELEIENEAQSDAIDGLQGFMAHFDLEDLE